MGGWWMGIAKHLSQRPCWKICFFQGKCWICWILWGMLNQNVLLSGEMLNVLNMLNVLGRTWPNPPPLSSSSPKNIQHIQHFQHFCSFKHILIQHAPRIQHIRHFPWKKHISEKVCSFQGKCWICWMFWGELGQTPPFLLALPKTFNIFNLFNISAVLSTFWFNSCLFGRKVHFFPSSKHNFA